MWALWLGRIRGRFALCGVMGCKELKKRAKEDVVIDQDLLAILACPKCKGGLKYLERQDGLACEACMLLYEIRDNIPVMLIEEARELLPEDLS